MKQLKVIWNKDHTASVVLSKLKEFTISDVVGTYPYAVRGWFNTENYFLFGQFPTFADAQAFVKENVCKNTKTAWNIGGYSCISLSKLKEFSIIEHDSHCPTDEKHHHVYGWYNQDNHFDFGSFKTPEGAEAFLDVIHGKY